MTQTDYNTLNSAISSLQNKGLNVTYSTESISDSVSFSRTSSAYLSDYIDVGSALFGVIELASPINVTITQTSGDDSGTENFNISSSIFGIPCGNVDAYYTLPQKSTSVTVGSTNPILFVCTYNKAGRISFGRDTGTGASSLYSYKTTSPSVNVTVTYRGNFASFAGRASMSATIRKTLYS